MRGGLSFPLIGTVLLSAPCVSAIAGLSMLSLVGLSAMFDHNKAESRISATLWLYQQFIETANERTPMRNMPNDIPAELPVAFYGSSKPVTHLDLMKVARTVLMELHLGLWDRVCVPVTLNHTFGFGSGQILWTLVILLVSSRSRIRILMLCALFSPAGALAALTAGSTVVLPGPEKDPNTTLRALDDEGCTVFLTDTHDLVNLRPLRLSGPTSLPWWASASGSEGALRTGLVKIGSGDELGKAPLESWCGVPLVSVGKLPVPG
jgi:hypothetical protein